MSEKKLKVYAGLCVGGPWDGRAVSAYENRVRAVKIPDGLDFGVMVNPNDAPVSEPNIGEITTYGWHPGVRISFGKFTTGFWLVEGSGNTIEWAIEHIMRAYHLKAA